MVNRILRAAAVTAACAFLAFPSACKKDLPTPPDTEAVGQTADNRTVVPVNQVVTPAGVQVPLPGLRPQTMALSPDEKFLAVAGKTSELLIIDPTSGQIGQRVTL
ncbi:MAG: lactonase family protein, partial [Candidatus Aminicenantes bacterium]|nr:lactonase family protein [Candidatus Aminicenantes bacterium]